MAGFTKRELRLILIGSLGWAFCLFLLAGWLFWGPGQQVIRETVERWNPPRPKEKELSRPLQAAIARFWKRGGVYVWGTNDCSIFILDYLKARGAPVSYRMTTHSMSNPREMEKLGYYLGRRTDSKEFIFVVRYRNEAGEWRGHTGVGVRYKGHRWYVHNAAGPGGLVIEEERTFASRMKEAGVSLDQLQCYVMPP